MKPHFKVFGIPVRVEPTFAIVALFGFQLGATLGIAWVVIVFATTLIHELGHAFAFRRYGRASSITLWAFGGFTKGEGGALTRGKTIVVSVAGPLAGMIVLGVPAILLRRSVATASLDVRAIMKMLEWVAITWSAVNLLPVLPLDGGHVSESILEGAFGLNGAKAARWLSIAVAAAAGGWALTQRYTFIAIYGAFFAMQNASELGRLGKQPAPNRLEEGHRAIDAGRADVAAKIANDTLAGSRDPASRIAALELAAWAYLVAGRRDDVVQLLTRYPDEFRASKALLATVRLNDGHRAAGIETAADAFTTGDAQNLTLARTLDRLGAVDELVDLLLRRGSAPAAALLAAHLQSAGRADLAAAITARLPS